MHIHNHQLYLLEQHNTSFKVKSEIIRINTEGKSLIMKSSPGYRFTKALTQIVKLRNYFLL